MKVEVKQLLRFFFASAIIVLSPLYGLIVSQENPIQASAMLGVSFVVAFLIAGIVLQFIRGFWR